ncbi:hypothetical protein WICPIJ_000892 [Wickerhamomyces pijperi]|uniref:Uncharacterized protein n=1 Tax=Wickerhamomyces pijperi TaxID=599730 RepID=A0A9P8QCV8_WICPI|nr:hypothetical protein WICPIJ_000892 [Wickerhamomyces pijperi]
MADFSLQDPLTRIIGLAFVLAMGFLATILASTLYHSTVLFFVGVLFLFAYTPVLICNQWKQSYDFMSEGSAAIVDFGKFLTGFLTVSGISIPLVLYHTAQIPKFGCILSIVGVKFKPIKELFPIDRSNDISLMPVISKLQKINALPRTHIQSTIGDRNTQASTNQSRLDMTWHIIRTFTSTGMSESSFMIIRNQFG